MPWWGLWLVSGLCLCVYSCVRVEFGFLPLIPKTHSFSNGFSSQLFSMAWNRGQPHWLSLFQGFCFLSLKPESAGRKRMTAWASTVVVLGSLSCITWWWFSTVKKILQAFMCGMYQAFRNEVSLQRDSYFLLSREICPHCYPELDLCLYLTGSSYHLS